MSDTLKLFLSLGLAFLIVLPLFWRLLPSLLIWAWVRPLPAALIALVLALVYRVVGVDYGLPDLFWHDDWKVQFWAGFSVALLFVLIVGLFLANEPVLAVLDPAQPADEPAASDVRSRLRDDFWGMREGKGRSGWTPASIRRVYASDDVIPDYWDPPPGWARRFLRPKDVPEGGQRLAFPFALRLFKLLVLFSLLFLLLIPPAVVSMIDRFWICWKSHDAGLIWGIFGDFVFPGGALLGALGGVACICLWRFVEIAVPRVFHISSDILRWVIPLYVVQVIGWLLGYFVYWQLPAAAAFCLLLGIIAGVHGFLYSMEEVWRQRGVCAGVR